jgi:type I restriction enzyme S subunit
LTAAEYVPEGYAFLSTPNIKNSVIDFENVNYIDEFRFEESPELKLQKGDVLLVKDGNTLGITNIVSDLPRAATVNGSIAVVRTDTLEPRFLRYALASDLVQEMIAAVKAGMGVPHLFQADIKKFPLPRPALLVQRAIADYLDSEIARIDALIEKKQRMVELLEERRRAAFDIFTVPTALGGTADAGGQRWDVASIKHMAHFFTDGDWIESPFIQDDGIRLIQTGNIGEGVYRDQGYRFISDQTFRELGCTEILPGDVLISRLAGPVGCACLAPNLDVRMVGAVDIVILRPRAALDRQFAVAYLTSRRHLALADLLARGTTMQRLSRFQVGQMRIPVPPIEQQRDAVSRLERTTEPLEEARDAVERQLRLVREHRQALITAAVTGEVEIAGVPA